MPTVDKLMRRLARLERQVDANASVPRLSNSSIDDGGAIRINNPETGEPQVIIGGQDDGTVGVVHVDGPPPPKPSTPIIEPHLGFLIVTWDGLFAAAASAPEEPALPPPTPLDYARMEIHGGTAGVSVDADSSTLLATIEGLHGGSNSIAVGYDEDTTIWLIARTLSGKTSVPSDTVAGRAGRIEAFDIAEAALLVTKFKTNQHLIF